MNRTGGNTHSGWLEWFPLSGSGASNRVEPALQHSWPWPLWATLLLLLIAGAWVVVMYLRESGHTSPRARLALMLLRLAQIGLVILMMYGFVVRPYRTDRPELILMLDDSASMSRGDGLRSAAQPAAAASARAPMPLGSTRRIELAKAILLRDNARLLRALDQQYRLRLYTISEPASVPWSNLPQLVRIVQGLSARHPASPVGDRLRGAIEQTQGRPLAAVVAMTDGVTTEGSSIQDLAGDAADKGMPLYLVGLGSEEPARDVQLSDALVDESVFVDDVLAFTFSVRSNGFAGKLLPIRLRQAGHDDVLAQIEVKLGPDGQTERLTLQCRPSREGTISLVLEAETLPGEANSDNNALRANVTVHNETIRVLLVQAYPSYEFRFLKNLLSRQTTDPAGQRQSPIELSTVLQQADPRYAETDRTALRGMPLALDELLNYDVILFGDVDPSGLGQTVMQNIAAFVIEHGRGAVIMAGPRYTPLVFAGTPLAALIPVDLSRAETPPPEPPLAQPFVVQLTRLGQIAPLLQLADRPEDNLSQWQSLPGLYWLLHAPEVKPGARVLAEHPQLAGDQGQGLPVICLQYVGAGKVLFHAMDETWRWRLEQGDRLYGRYWLQVIRFLSRWQLSQRRPAELSTDAQRYPRGAVVPLQLRYLDDRQAPEADDAVSVMLRPQGQAGRRVALGRDGLQRGLFRASLEGLSPGRYVAWVVAPAWQGDPPRCEFRVEALEREWTQSQANLAGLRQAADQSGGRYYTFDSAGRLLKDLPPGGQIRVEPLAPRPLWNSSISASLLIGLLVAEWLLRRRAGLL